VNRQLRLSFLLPEAQADWAGSALAHVFPDGVVVQASARPTLSRVFAWLPPQSKLRLPQIKKELSAIGAREVRAAWQLPKAWVGPKAKPFPLVRLGRFIAVPAARKNARVPKTLLPIYLIQAQAFGTGLHESTRLMLRGIEGLSKSGALKGAALLDVGAGSGILGFGALHLGAASVTCVEIETAACAELRENRALNAVAPRRMPVLAGRYPLGRLRARRYPFILGNLVTPVLEALMPALAKQLTKGGRLFCSGIHTQAEARRVTRAAQAQGLGKLGAETLHDWHRLDFGKA
jgi:ribosomal protein L11 methyltransferase